jgi:recombination protein RecA
MKEQILLGTLLGDAYIGKLIGKSKSYKIGWEHSQQQKDYALWKAENSLSHYSIYERSRLDIRTNNIYHSIIIYSKKDDYKKYRELFYPFGIKEVSNQILNMLTPLAIAVWFMDDGNLYYNGNNCHLTLSVNGFNEESVENIIKYFKDKYNINFKKSQSAIRLTSVKEVKKFELHFANLYHESMNYKKLFYAKQKHKNR